MPASRPTPLRRAAAALLPFAVVLLSTPAVAAPSAPDTRWIPFPDPTLEVRGLPWLKENAPEVWRLPASAKAKIPPAVWTRGLAPAGGRIRLSSTTTRLLLRAQLAGNRTGPCHFDLFVDGRSAGSATLKGKDVADLILAEHLPAHAKDLTLYLPHNHPVRILALGLDAAATVQPPTPFALDRPLVCYGSSVLQGTGSTHPATTYPAALARQLNLDFVNLGFGGAGKAETDVVQLVNSLDACAYLFDLGKSYGAQPAEPFARMLDTLRAAHPTTPIFVVTPIYSRREPTDSAYAQRSVDLRHLMRDAARTRAAAGDQHLHVVEGLDLFGAADADAMHDDQHPDDTGNLRIADRLAPLVRRTLPPRLP